MTNCNDVYTHVSLRWILRNVGVLIQMIMKYDEWQSQIKWINDLCHVSHAINFADNTNRNEKLRKMFAEWKNALSIYRGVRCVTAFYDANALHGALALPNWNNVLRILSPFILTKNAMHEAERLTDDRNTQTLFDFQWKVSTANCKQNRMKEKNIDFVLKQTWVPEIFQMLLFSPHKQIKLKSLLRNKRNGM